MNYNRAKNAKRNIIFGLISKCVSILLPFVVRTVIIKVIGEQYLGLSSLFTSVLMVLSLTELGFGEAVVYNMYKPVAEGDMDTVCALLNFYRKVYRVVGCSVLVLGVALIPLLPNFIHGTYPSDINLTLVYLIYLGNTALSYFLFAYLSAPIIAYQRKDISSKAEIITTAAMNVLQVAAILITKNYYVYAVVIPACTILRNLLIAYIVKKKYPELECRGKLEKKVLDDIKEKIKGLLISKLCFTSRNALDNIFVSAFLGLTLTAIYNNYYYIMSAVLMILSIVTSSIVGTVGNSVATESQEKNYSDMNHMNFVYMGVSGWCAICLLCLMQPFMELWMGRELMFQMPVVILFSLYFYVLKMGDIRSVYVDATGIWWESRYRSILEAVCNVVLNYVLGKAFGVYGIIGATLISLFFVNFCYGSTIVFKHYFTRQKVSEYFRTHFMYLFVTAAIGAATYWVCSFVQSGLWMTLILRGLICCAVPTLLYFLVYSRYKFGRESVKWLLERAK